MVGERLSKILVNAGVLLLSGRATTTLSTVNAAKDLSKDFGTLPLVSGELGLALKGDRGEARGEVAESRSLELRSCRLCCPLA